MEDFICEEKADREAGVREARVREAGVRLQKVEPVMNTVISTLLHSRQNQWRLGALEPSDQTSV